MKTPIDKAIELLSELGERRPALEQLRRAKEVIYALRKTRDAESFGRVISTRPATPQRGLTVELSADALLKTLPPCDGRLPNGQETCFTEHSGTYCSLGRAVIESHFSVAMKEQLIKRRRLGAAVPETATRPPDEVTSRLGNEYLHIGDRYFRVATAPKSSESRPPDVTNGNLWDLLTEARAELDRATAPRVSENVLPFVPMDLRAGNSGGFVITAQFPCQPVRLEIASDVALHVEVRRFKYGHFCPFDGPIHGEVFSATNRRWAPVALPRAHTLAPGHEIHLEVLNLSVQTVIFRGVVVVERVY